VLWLLEELEVPYEVVKYERIEDLARTQVAAADPPLGKSPVITDGELVIAESANILEYLVDTYGKGRSPAGGDAAYRHYDTSCTTRRAR